MPSIRLLFFILFLPTIPLLGQKPFRIASATGPQMIKLNGQKYRVDSTGIMLHTQFSRFDTLSFCGENPNVNDPILCNFKPDSSYTIIQACCGSLDIVSSAKWKLLEWNGEYDENYLLQTQLQLMDRPYLFIKTKRPPKDSLYAWHNDPACETSHHLIHTDPWPLGVPPKCYYWSNITYITFFKTDSKSTEERNNTLEEFLGLENVVELGHVGLRLFDDQKFLLTFDERKRAIRVGYFTSSK